MSLWKNMLASQMEIKHAIKDSKNPHLKNRYASLNAVLDEVKPIFNKNGLVLTQHVRAVTPEVKAICVCTRITDAETGEFTDDQCVVPVKSKFKDGADLGPDAQELGSAITYGRRYGLLAMCAIASEDDDGEGAVNGIGAVVSREPARLVGTDPVKTPDAGASKSMPTAEEVKAKVAKALGGFTPLKKGE